MGTVFVGKRNFLEGEKGSLGNKIGFRLEVHGMEEWQSLK